MLGRSSSIVSDAIKSRTAAFEDVNQNPWAQEIKQKPKPPVPTRPQSEVFTKPVFNRPQSEMSSMPLNSSPKPPIPTRPKSNDADTSLNRTDSPKMQPKRSAPAPPKKPDIFSLLENTENQAASAISTTSDSSINSNDQFLNRKPPVPLSTKPPINRPAIPSSVTKPPISRSSIPPSTNNLNSVSSSINSISDKPPLSDRLNSVVSRPAPLPPRPALKLVHNIPEDAYQRYQELFKKTDKFNQGFLSPTSVRNLWLKSQLAPIKLGQIWKLLELTNGGLNELEFCIGTSC